MAKRNLELVQAGRTTMGLAAVELDGNWVPGVPGSWTRDACIFNVFSVMTSIL